MTDKIPIQELDKNGLELVELAKKAQQSAYAPYSKFLVGCALIDKRGKIFTGCNVENASLSLTSDAERTAIVKMVSDGGREIERIMVITSDKEPVFPCGSCRQIINEFGEEAVIYAIDSEASCYRQTTTLELLPIAISRNQVER